MKGTMKRVVLGVTFISAGILAVAIGQRLGMDAPAVVVGIIIGATVSIPAGVVFALVARQLQGWDARFRRECDQPPVVIVGPQGTAHFPRGDSDGHFCYPGSRQTHERGGQGD